MILGFNRQEDSGIHPDGGIPLEQHYERRILEMERDRQEAERIREEGRRIANEPVKKDFYHEWCKKQMEEQDGC